jgi:hypothetical protein
MASWDFDTCALCHGSGELTTGKCPICNGFGLWEFVNEDNNLAVQSLVRGETPANEHVKELCERRLAQITPDNLESVLDLLEKEEPTDDDFNALQLDGATRWGWAWVHANRFAIELARLCGGDPTEHRYALSRIAWKWLLEENQKKIDAPIDKLNPSLL